MVKWASIRVIAWGTLAGATAVALATAAFAPYVYVELWPRFHSVTVVNPGPVSLIKGRMFDDYFAVEDLGVGTYAIGEPHYYQANYSYLIIGEAKALLFDAGSGTRDMRPVVSALTDLPVTVLPSHLHYDHLGGVASFDRVALLDLEGTRGALRDGRFTPGRYDFLGMFDGLQAPSFAVSEWIEPGSTIDLGGRSLTVLSTPGHTKYAVALHDQKANRLFTGDFIYPTMLYAFLPGASLSAYRKTAGELLKTLNPETTLWAAHCCRRDEVYSAPWLSMDDLADLDSALALLQAGSLDGEGFFPRRYPINEQMTLGAAFPWTNR